MSVSYYEDIQKMPAITEQDMNAILKEESQVLWSLNFTNLRCNLRLLDKIEETGHDGDNAECFSADLIRILFSTLLFLELVNF